MTTPLKNFWKNDGERKACELLGAFGMKAVEYLDVGMVMHGNDFDGLVMRGLNEAGEWEIEVRFRLARPANERP